MGASLRSVIGARGKGGRDAEANEKKTAECQWQWCMELQEILHGSPPVSTVAGGEGSVVDVGVATLRAVSAMVQWNEETTPSVFVL